MAFYINKAYVLDTSKRNGVWFNLRLGLVPFTLHPTKTNTLQHIDLKFRTLK